MSIINCWNKTYIMSIFNRFLNSTVNIFISKIQSIQQKKRDESPKAIRWMIQVYSFPICLLCLFSNFELLKTNDLNVMIKSLNMNYVVFNAQMINYDISIVFLYKQGCVWMH